ncbi:hypothetical protein D3C76_1503040 [compost metagenome]
MGQDDNRKVQVRTGKGQKSLTFGRRHDAGQQVQLALFGLLKDDGPAYGFNGCELYGQSLAYRLDIVGSQTLIATLIVAKLKRGP